jgi:RHS repeat-associated protein
MMKLRTLYFLSALLSFSHLASAQTITVSGPSTICSSSTTNVGFSANITNGGTSPTYTWLKNGIVVSDRQTGPPAYVYVAQNPLVNGDRISCKLTASSGIVVTSAEYVVALTNSITPTVSINFPRISYCVGETIIFTANSSYITGSSTYTWTLNGSTVSVPTTASSISVPVTTTATTGYFYPGSTVAVTANGLSGTCLLSTSATGTFSSGGIISVTPVPLAPNASNLRVHYNVPATLSVSGGVITDTYKWYDINDVYIGQGTTYTTTNSLTQNTTYKVSKITSCEGPKTTFLAMVNQPPIVDAGLDQSISLRNSFTLWGNATDADGTIATFAWTKTSGGAITMTTDQNKLTLTNIVAGSYVFRLTATDDFGDSSFDEVTVTAANVTNNYNYVSEDLVNIPGQTTSAQVAALGIGDKYMVIQYGDDAGKAVQTVQCKGSPSAKDLVSTIEYDALGRSSKSYLPIASSQTSGYFIPNVLGNGTYTGSMHQTFYSNSSDKIADDAAPYSTATFELSPLGRTLQQGSVGTGFQPVVGQKFKTLGYGANVSGDIRIYTIAANLPVSTTAWDGNLLSVQSVFDENSVESQVVTSPEGLKIVSRTRVDVNTWSETYYVYDTRNRLKFMLPPELMRILKAAANYSPTQAQIDTWAFQYTYDDIGRTIETKGPGTDWSYTIYDNRDRVVLTQDAKQRLSNEWSYSKYDELNRPLISGIYRPGSAITRAAMQSTIDALNGGIGYQNLGPQTVSGIKMGIDIIVSAYESINEYKVINSITLKSGFSFTAGTTAAAFRSSIDDGSVNSTAADIFPNANDEALVISYYDTYNDCSICQDVNYQFVSEAWGVSSNEPFQKFTRIKDKTVAGSVKVVGTSGQWLNTVTYYNRQGQAIQTVSSNHVNGIERHSTLPDFSGKTLRALTTYLGMAIPVSTILRRFDYDHMGRVLKTYHQINNQPEVVLSANEYNELGQVVDKSIHSVAGSPYLQSVDYRYNIRGASLQMNSTAGDAGDPAPDYFRMEMGYENTFGALNSARYDGAVSGMKWKQDLSTKEKGYGFNYDNQGWLTAANYKLNNSDNWLSQNGYYNEDGLSYDFNGNIKTLSRKQKTSAVSAPVIDQLAYNYGSGGNKLFGVTDSAPAADRAKGFKDTNTTGDDYVYDINGNLVQDKNKKFTITYNFQNLPDRITFTNNSYIQYMYDAGGTKLRQAYYDSTLTLKIKTDYIGELMLLNDQLQLVHHEEGRAIPADYTNLIPNPTREGGSLEGYTATTFGPAPTLSVETIGSQTYVKVVNNQAGSTPGVYPLGPTYNVKPGESYQFTVLSYQSIGTTASLYVWGNNGNIVWPGAALPIGSANEAIVTANFTVPTGTTQINLGVIWNSPAVGNTFYINRVALYKTDFEYQYFLTDQVGSPRVVLQTNAATTTHAATMETENFSTENPKWLNLNSTRFTIPPSVPLANATPGGDQSIVMDNTYRVGPAKSFKVFPGDQINGNVQAYYTTGGFSQATATSTMITALQTVLSGGSTVIDGAIQSAYSTTGNPAIALGGYKGTTRPSAYLNYILFDENYVPLKAKSFPVQDNMGVRHTVAFDAEVQVEELGYLFVYLSYENENTVPVYFDELRITYTESPVIQVNNYYPFGLTATEWVREGETDNNFLFQEKELEDKTGLHDFRARQYDAATGRWFAVDPAGQFSSPYNAMGNNPVMSVDPDGRLAWFVPIIIGAIIGGTSQGIAAENNGGHFFDGFWKGALVGAAAGATGAGIGAAVNSTVLAGAGAGFVAGAGSAGFASNWDLGEVFRGGVIGGLSGALGGGIGSAIGGGGGAFAGGFTSDAASQLLSSGNIDLSQAGIAGATSFGLYHGLALIHFSQKSGNPEFDNLTIGDKYRLSRMIQRQKATGKEFAFAKDANGKSSRILKSKGEPGGRLYKRYGIFRNNNGKIRFWKYLDKRHMSYDMVNTSEIHKDGYTEIDFHTHPGKGPTDFSGAGGDIDVQNTYNIKHAFVLNRDNIVYRPLNGGSINIGSTNHFLMRSIFGF